jgi:predicted branched-subunit amino acid permease
MSISSTRHGSATRSGILTMLPLLVGYMPFGLVVGSAVAHLATIQTLDGAGFAAAVITGLLINARLVVYSTSLARRWRGQPRWFRFAAAGLIIDPTWAVADRHAEQCPDDGEQRRFFLATALTLATGWSVAIAAGALLGARLDGLDLQIAVPLCLLGLVGTGLRARGTRTVSLAAGAAALVTVAWPSGTGLLAAVAAGCLAGWVGDTRRRP